MDRLHWIQGSAIPGVSIPYVCNDRFTFDNGLFWDYPFRCGMTKDPDDISVSSLNLHDKAIDEVAPFLQAWLYFGILHEIFTKLLKTDYEWTDFVRTMETGEVVITTEMLPMYIWCWAAYESAIPPEVNYGARTVSGLMQTCDVVISSLVTDDQRKEGAFAPKKSLVEPARSLGQRVVMSIIVLCETITAAGRQIYDAQPDAYKPRFGVGFPSLLAERLKSAGYCPWQILQLESDSNMDCGTAYTLSRIDRTQLGKDHSRCSANDKCYGYDVDYDTYTTRHVVPHCACVELPCAGDGVSLSISWILDDGGLPLLLLDDTGDDEEAAVRVVYSSLGDKARIPQYVAISHVWSDGLGNQERNALPLCVLRKLQRQVNALFSIAEAPVPFWVDTICVPLDNKLPALQAMFQTYQNASVVLVLDASLESVFIEVPPQERLLRIRVSPWMQRLWTLQEGWVAQELAFQFAEAACRAEAMLKESITAPNPLKLQLNLLMNARKNNASIKKLIRALAVDYRAFPMPDDKMLILRKALEEGIPGYPKGEDIELARLINRRHLIDSVSRGSTTALLNLLDSRSFSVAHKKNPAAIFNILKNRNTSRKEDEMYCIANLLQLPVAPILAVRPDLRMKKLLTMMPQVPAAVIFSHQFKRMEDPGFSWAPKTFMDISAVAYDGLAMGRVTNKGLQISLPGLRIQNPRALTRGVPDGRDNWDGRLVYLALSSDEERFFYMLGIIYPPVHAPTTWADFTGKELRVIVRRTSPDENGRVSDTTDAALVSVISQEDNVCTVKFIITIWMRRLYQKVVETPSQDYYVGEWLDDGVEWCII
ncbi:hypothetical protein LTR10_018270 [Elasticomyces elasticus]|uniref:Heterokaryon incompatibility domain-containing protein n=1 Tax=Exophiala sideris TaxID=1016849 RepID=A0ABR0JJN8_9EURO|nr:hypothetical protein LTR10_018270 [Elasticomyces elasticus]KAK5034488.1 hypothetical protein LTS07_003409 [Exophiala sideris]KAK5042784.1 hypothetical protein LTR13_001632 [Exophiala sideris]KAK5065867.1 hypothetical protein LTR69_003417 [Exophiala sideris]KAK5185671.1 hypothetical protein LTR44_001720 [Eurotiomycetes sp. CCFEE 6388]